MVGWGSGQGLGLDPRPEIVEGWLLIRAFWSKKSRVCGVRMTFRRSG